MCRHMRWGLVALMILGGLTVISTAVFLSGTTLGIDVVLLLAILSIFAPIVLFAIWMEVAMDKLCDCRC